MTTRTTYVPLHSIWVVRDDKQVDAYAEYQRTGKAFKFTSDEIDEIAATNDGNLEQSLRAPNDEAAPNEAPAGTMPAASNETAPADAKAKTGGKAKDTDL